MSFGHLKTQIKHQDLRNDNVMHVIGVIANPTRYHSRYRLFKQWRAKMLRTKGVKLHIVECVYGNRKPECEPDTTAKDGWYNYLRVHSKSEIWVKESLINLAEKHLLPRNWKYLSWVDCDILFRNKNWAINTMHQLQHYPVVQPWSDAVDLAFDGSIIQHFKSCGFYSAKHIPQAPNGKDPYGKYGHTGFAWSCTRYFWENTRGLPDFAILGAGDNHFAWSCLGRVKDTINPKITDGYKHACNDVQRRAKYASGGIIGYTPGRIEHWFHGSKKKRGYWDRWQILVKHKYNPLTDLGYTSEGLIKLKGKKKLEHDIMLYNRNRREDDISND